MAFQYAAEAPFDMLQVELCHYAIVRYNKLIRFMNAILNICPN